MNGRTFLGDKELWLCRSSSGGRCGKGGSAEVFNLLSETFWFELGSFNLPAQFEGHIGYAPS